MVLVGFGRVGSRIGADLEREEVAFLVIEDHHELVDKLRAAVSKRFTVMPPRRR